MPNLDLPPVLKLLGSLDEPLSVAVKLGALASARLTPPKALGIEMLLCALYRKYENKLAQYYHDERSLKFLCDALWPNETPTSAVFLSGTEEAAGNECDTAVGFHVEIDPELERILLNAARIAFALFRTETSIPELAASMSTEELVCESLKSKWGIELRGHP